MKKFAYAAVVTFCAAVLPLAAKNTVVEEIVARVNDKVITTSELARARTQLQNEVRQQAPTNADTVLQQKEKDLLRDLIDRQLLVSKANDLGITADTDLVKRLDQMRKQMNLSSMEELQKAAEAEGIAYEDFKDNMKNQILMDKVIQQEVGSHISVTMEEAQKFYNDHKKDLDQPESVTLSEILITPKAPGATQNPNAAAQNAQAGNTQQAVDPQAQAQADTDAEAKAKQVLAELKAGAKFEDLAQKYSDGPTASDGGDLGQFKRGTMAKELEDKTFAMKAGDVTDVIRTKQGFVILKVTDHRQPGIPAFASIEEQMKEQVYLQKLEPALREYLTKLREEAYIDIKPGYIDSGASPNESKPVEMSDNSPTPKGNLKRKKTLGVF